MKNIFNIYKNDINNIIKNYAALIAVIALCILPSLYAWFNIAASWDPYSPEATSQIKIGVVNKDTGSSINGQEINLGNNIIEGLKDNDLMGWQFVSEDEANNNLEQGKYYASITIPEEFSKDMTSLITSNIKKGEIIYAVNEKINAIAPKLTSKGASGVQENVNKTLIETVSKALLTITKDIGVEIENAMPRISNVYNMLEEVRGRFTEVNKTIDLAYEGAVNIKELVEQIQSDIPLIKETLSNSKNLTSEVKNFIASSKNGLSNISPTIKEDIRLISEISGDISNYSNAIIEAINSGSDKAPEMVDNLIGKVNIIDELTKSLLKILESINKFVPNKPLNGVIGQLQTIKERVNKIQDSLQDIKEAINEGNTIDLSLLNNIKSLADSVNSTSSNLYSKFDTEIQEKINVIFDQAFKVAENVLTVLQEAETKLPDVENILNVAYESADKGIEGITFIKEKLPEAELIINELTDKMRNVNDNESLQELIDLLKNDVQERTEFLSNPVNLVKKTLFTMGNYGTAMTPFYTTLSLWTGLLFLVSMLSVDKHGNYTANEVYFGKLLLFLTIAVIQALIVSIGDLVILDIYCLNPILFILGAVFTSIVFTFIVYSACSVFGNVGKVACIVLLVLQLGGSGGTFPIELTPKFFQRIHPLLPFTYTISISREAIGGVVRNILLKDILICLCFIFGAMIIAVFAKKPINKVSNKFTEKFKESGIGEE